MLCKPGSFLAVGKKSCTFTVDAGIHADSTFSQISDGFGSCWRQRIYLYSNRIRFIMARTIGGEMRKRARDFLSGKFVQCPVDVSFDAVFQELGFCMNYDT